MTRLELLLGAIHAAILLALLAWFAPVNNERAVGFIAIGFLTTWVMLGLIQRAVTRKLAGKPAWWNGSVSERAGSRIVKGALAAWLVLVAFMAVLAAGAAFLRTSLGFPILAVYAVSTWLAWSSNRKAGRQSIVPYAIWLPVGVVIAYCALRLTLGPR